MKYGRFSFDRPIFLQYVENGYRTFIEISNESGVPQPHVAATLQLMKNDGLVSSDAFKKGHAQNYSVTDAGRSRLAEYKTDYPVFALLLPVIPKRSCTTEKETMNHA